MARAWSEAAGDTCIDRRAGGDGEAALDLLLVPAPRPGEAGGAYATCLALALALRRRRPDVRAGFLLREPPPTPLTAPFRQYLQPVDAAGSKHCANLIAKLRPQVAVFGAGSPTSLLRACRFHGVRTVCITSDTAGLRKAFRPDWLYLLDHHWHQRERVTQPPFSPLQRRLARLSPVERLVYDTIYADTPADAADLPPTMAERLRRPFVLFLPGAAPLRGRQAAAVYLEAAEAFHRATGLDALTLVGPSYRPELPEQRTLSLPGLSQPTLMELLRRSAVAVTSGGTCLHYALHCGASVVCTAADAAEAERIADYAAAGLLAAAPPVAAALAAEAARLVREPEAARQLRQRASGIRFVNGIPPMADTLSQLIHAAGPEALSASAV